MYRTLIGLVLLLASLGAWANSYPMPEGRLLSQSKTGRTVVFDLGTHDGMKEGDYAIIVKQIRDLDTRDLRFIPAAKARNIKVSTDSSIWIIYHIYDGELMVNKQKYMVLTESNMLRGRRDLEIARTTLVGPKGKIKDTAIDGVTEDKNKLAKLKSAYQTSSETHQQTEKSNNDFELLDLEEWEKAKGERYRVALYRSPHKEEFRRSYRLDQFHKMVASYLVKVNEPNFSYDRFYDEQMRASFSNEFRQRSNVSEYENFLKNQALKRHEDARIYRSILEKGESWSEDFSDEELRVVLNNVSVLQEQDRRKIVVSKPLRHVFVGEYGMILNDSQTDRDTTYRRRGLREFAADYEATPFLRHALLERFTVNGTGRITSSAYDNDGRNVDLDMMTVSLGINWYPVHPPYTIKAPLFFLGTYLRSGYARVESPVTKEGAKYGVLSVPAFRAGLRYTFQNNFGLRILASMETLKMERYEVNQFGSSLPDRETLVEGKLGIGITYSF